MAAALGESIDKWARGYVDADRVPCMAAAVSHEGRLVYKGQHGWADKQAGRALSGSDVFHVASCTKVMTSVAAMQLFERGLWALDDAVSKFIPAFADVPGVLNAKGDLVPLERAISMRDLLTHTAGLTYSIMPFLRDGRANPIQQELAKLDLQSQTLEEVANGLASLPLVHQPGRVWEYSMGIDVVGRVVEVLSGMTIDVYFNKYILEPLDMRSTCFVQNATQEMQARRVQCYSANVPAWMQDQAAFYNKDFSGERMKATPPHEDFTNMPLKAFNPGGGLLSTVDDWLKFAECLCRGGVCADGQRRILGASTFELMARDHLPADFRFRPQPVFVNGRPEEEKDCGFGLGSAVAKGSTGHGVLEWGGMTSTVFWADTQRKVAAVCFTQLLPSFVYPFRSELKGIIERSFPAPQPSAPPPRSKL